MDLNLPEPRSVFLPQVPEQLNAFKGAIEIAIARSWDNVDAIRSALGSVTTGTVAGIVVVTAAVTKGALITYASSGTAGNWTVLPAGNTGDLLTWSGGSPVTLSASGPLDADPAVAGSIIVATAGDWSVYTPGSTGSVLTINASTLPVWATPVGGGNLMYAFYGMQASAGGGFYVDVGDTAVAAQYSGIMVTGNQSNIDVVRVVFYKTPTIGNNVNVAIGARLSAGVGTATCNIALATTSTGIILVSTATNDMIWHYGTIAMSGVANNTWSTLQVSVTTPAGVVLRIRNIIIVATS